MLCCSLVCGAPPVAGKKLPPLAMFIRRELSDLSYCPRPNTSQHASMEVATLMNM